MLEETLGELYEAEKELSASSTTSTTASAVDTPASSVCMTQGGQPCVPWVYNGMTMHGYYIQSKYCNSQKCYR